MNEDRCLILVLLVSVNRAHDKEGGGQGGAWPLHLIEIILLPLRLSWKFAFASLSKTSKILSTPLP